MVNGIYFRPEFAPPKGPKHQSGRVRPGEQASYPIENTQLYAKNRHVKEMYFWTKVGAQKSVKYVSGGAY